MAVHTDGNSLQIGEDIGGYRILRKIGAGAMGAVYEVEHRFLKQRFALKMLTQHDSTLEERTEAAKLFLQEARITAQLHHPGIVSVQTLDIDPKSGLSYFVMDYVAMTKQRRNEILATAITSGKKWFNGDDGEVPDEDVKLFSLSLEDLCAYARKNKARLLPEIVRRLLIDICSALHYAHTFGVGVLHRDIKPANLLIRSDGHAVIADFGVAKVMDRAFRKHIFGGTSQSLSLRMDEDGAMYHLIRGTRDYMAPELFEGAPPTPRTDLYALGVTAYELLTGEMFSNGALPPSSYDVPQEWDPLIQRCLRADPKARWESVEAFRQELERLPERIQKRTFRQKLILGGAIFGALCLCGIATAAITKHLAQDVHGIEALHFPPETPKEDVVRLTPLERGWSLNRVHADFCGTLDLRNEALERVSPNAFTACEHPIEVLYPPKFRDGVDPMAQVFTTETCPGGVRILGAKPHVTPYLTIPERIHGEPVLEIRAGAFRNRKDLREVLLPSSLRAIRKEAFRGSAVERVFFAEGLEVIEPQAFAQTQLQFADLPPSVRTVGARAFEGCPMMSDNGTNTAAPQNAAFSTKTLSDGTLAIISYNATHEVEIILPETFEGKTITTICPGAFEYCKKAKSLKLPETITTLENAAFKGMESLEKITLPASFTIRNGEPRRGGAWLFQHCKSLKSVTFLGQIDYIPNATFSHCPSLKYISFPGKTLPKREVTRFDFEDVPDRCQVVLEGSGHRYWYRQKTNDFELIAYALPKKTSSNTSEAPVNENAKNAASETPKPVSNKNDFEMGGYKTKTPGGEKYYIIRMCTLTDATHITIPETIWGGKGVIGIEKGAFSSCKRAETLTIPKTIETIGQNAFSGMDSLKQLTIPESVELIRGYGNCKALEEITFLNPNATFQKGESHIFKDYPSLKRIRFAGDTFPEVDLGIYKNSTYKPVNTTLEDVFDGIPEDCVIELMGSGERYRYNATTKRLEQIGTSSSKTKKPTEEANRRKDTSDVAPKREAPSKTPSDPSKPANAFTPVTSSDGNFVTNRDLIGGPENRRILKCNLTDATHITIPKTIDGNPVTCLSNNSFSACKSVESITIPNTVWSIGTAFSGLDRLKTLTIPESVKFIGSVGKCNALEEIAFLNPNAKFYERNAFKDYPSLKRICFAGDAFPEPMEKNEVTLEDFFDGIPEDCVIDLMGSRERYRYNATTRSLEQIAYISRTTTAAQKTVNGFVVENIDKLHCRIVGYDPEQKTPKGTLIVPQKLGGKKVSAIASGAFVDLSLEAVSFEKTDNIVLEPYAFGVVKSVTFKRDHLPTFGRLSFNASGEPPDFFTVERNGKKKPFNLFIEHNNCTYLWSADGGCILFDSGSKTQVVIPEKVKGRIVSGIAPCAITSHAKVLDLSEVSSWFVLTEGALSKAKGLNTLHFDSPNGMKRLLDGRSIDAVRKETPKKTFGYNFKSYR